MKVHLESTSRVVEVNGHQARVWQGMTEGGVAITALIARVTCERSADVSAFGAELVRQLDVTPTVHTDAYPDRLVL